MQSVAKQDKQFSYSESARPSGLSILAPQDARALRHARRGGCARLMAYWEVFIADLWHPGAVKAAAAHLGHTAETCHLARHDTGYITKFHAHY